MRNCKLFSKVATPFYNPACNISRFRFLHKLASTYIIVCPFKFSPSCRCKVTLDSITFDSLCTHTYGHLFLQVSIYKSPLFSFSISYWEVELLLLPEGTVKNLTYLKKHNPIYYYSTLIFIRVFKLFCFITKVNTIF